MNNKISIAAAVAVPLLIAIVILFWLASGYGEVSRDAYRVAQALYGCCLAKSEPRLELVDSLLKGDDDQPPLDITTKERQWLEAMVDQAKNGDWQSSATAARQMMEDQVKH